MLHSRFQSPDSRGGVGELFPEFGFKDLAAFALRIRLGGQAMRGRGGRFHFPSELET